MVTGFWLGLLIGFAIGNLAGWGAGFAWAFYFKGRLTDRRGMVTDDLPHIAPEWREQWRKDCLHWRGRVLTGAGSHWCDEWDGLPIDESTPEWPCGCAPWGCNE